jgi:cytochrome c oxidase cbb3-type subunit 3
VSKNVYETRRVLCHGEKGLGDGRMSKVIKTPPPYNLTLSRLPKSYLMDIVSKGGAQMQRSPQMPPWGEQLSPSEINSVVDYIMQLRTY